MPKYLKFFTTVTAYFSHPPQFPGHLEELFTKYQKKENWHALCATFDYSTWQTLFLEWEYYQKHHRVYSHGRVVLNGEHFHDCKKFMYQVKHECISTFKEKYVDHRVKRISEEFDQSPTFSECLQKALPANYEKRESLSFH